MKAISDATWQQALLLASRYTSEGDQKGIDPEVAAVALAATLVSLCPQIRIDLDELLTAVRERLAGGRRVARKTDSVFEEMLATMRSLAAKGYRAEITTDGIKMFSDEGECWMTVPRAGWPEDKWQALCSSIRVMVRGPA